MTVTTEQGKIKPVQELEQIEFMTGTELEKADIEKPFFIIKKVLPTGLAILASPPKFGKSWLVLLMALCVANGKKFLGFDTEKVACLYLALEDSSARIKERTEKIMNGEPFPENFIFSVKARDISHGLIEQLEMFMQQRPDTKLIIIDTFQKVRGSMGRGESAYSADYRDTGVLKSFADAHKICICLVHHTKKARDIGDVFANISGTLGISGAADTMLVLSREKRTDETTLLSITGRDVEAQEFSLTFDKNTCKWKLLGEAAEVVPQTEIRRYNADLLVQAIRNLVKGSPDGHWCGSVSTLQKEARERFGIAISESIQSIGRRIGKLEEMLYQQDFIEYWSESKNGSGGKLHHFKRTKPPFND